jgi:hypothetical protein
MKGVYIALIILGIIIVIGVPILYLTLHEQKKDLMSPQEYACYKITDRLDEEKCYYRLYGTFQQELDTTNCDKIFNEAYRYTCYFKVAINNNDSSLCTNTIGYIEDKDNELFDQCHYWIGANTKNSNHCNEIVNQNKKILCIAEANENPQLCSQLPQYGSETEGFATWSGCVTKIAISKKDATICDAITYYEGDKENCYLNVNEQLENIQ